MKIREYLDQIAKWDAMIRNKQEDWKDQFEIATSITAKLEGDRVKSTGNHQKMADAAGMCAEIANQIKEIQRKRNEVISVIELLPTDEYELIYNVYVRHMDLADAADEKKRSYSWATTVQGRAYQRIRKILDMKKGG